MDVGAAAGSFDFAQDFASRLGRLLSGSSSNPSGPAKLIAVIAGIARDRRDRECKREIYSQQEVKRVKGKTKSQERRAKSQKLAARKQQCNPM
jgi:hypothetical protein